MKSVIHNLTFDCTNPTKQAEFWAAVLGYELREADEKEALIADPKKERPHLLFLVVPESKTIKNRLHFDLRADTSLDEEVARLEKLGATIYHKFTDDKGADTFTVMKDPEGNEFCVERGG